MRINEPTIRKKDIIRSMKNLPENVLVDDLIERIILLSKIEQGMAEAKAGKGISIEAMQKKVRSWSK